MQKADQQLFQSNKKESYNFVTQKNSNLNANAQELMRRNHSKEYYPMIVKSSKLNRQQ